MSNQLWEIDVFTLSSEEKFANLNTSIVKYIKNCRKCRFRPSRFQIFPGGHAPGPPRFLRLRRWVETPLEKSGIRPCILYVFFSEKQSEHVFLRGPFYFWYDLRSHDRLAKFSGTSSLTFFSCLRLTCHYVRFRNLNCWILLISERSQFVNFPLPSSRCQLVPTILLSVTTEQFLEFFLEFPLIKSVCDGIHCGV